LSEVTKWRVIETPSVVSRLGRAVGLPSKLSFESDWRDSAEQRDQSNQLIYASGFIQCVPSGLSAISDFALASRFLILDRVPIVESTESFVAIQRTTKALGEVGSSYPSWFFAEHEFHKAVASSWRINLSWQVPEDRPVVHRARRPFRGFLLERLWLAVGVLVLSTRKVLSSGLHSDHLAEKYFEMSIDNLAVMAVTPI